MSTASIKAGQAHVELYADDKPLVRALKRARDRMIAFTDIMKKTEASVLYFANRIALGFGAMATAIMGPSKIFADFGDKFEKMAYRTGMGTAALSEYAYAAEMCGASIEDFEGALKAMQTKLLDAAQGKAESAELLKLLGLSYRQLANMSPEEQFEAVAGAIADIEDPTLRAAMAMKLLGGSGTKLLPMLDAGSEGIAELRKEARLLGVSLSEEDATAAAELTDAMTRLKKAFLGVALSIGSALAPVLIDVFNRLAPLVGMISQFIRENAELVATILALAARAAMGAAAMMTLGYAFSALLLPLKIMLGLAPPLLALFGMLKTAIMGVIGVLSVLAGMPAVIVGAFAALIGAVFYFSGAGSALIQRVAGAFWALYDGVTRSVKAISNAIMAGDWSAAFAVLWTGIKALFAEGWNWIVQTAAECAGLITQWFYQAFESIVGSEIASWFADAFGQIMDVFSMVTHFLMEAWSVAQAFIMNGITLAAAFFMNTWSHVQEFFTIWFVRLSGLFNLLFGWIVNIGKTVLSTIGNVIGWTIARIGDVIKIIGNVISFVSGLLKPLFSLIMTVAVPVFNFLKSGFLTFVDALLWGFGKAWDLISGLVGMVANLAKWAIGFFDWLTGVDGKVKKIADEAEAARTKRSQNAADTVASRNAQPANQGSATDQWEKTLAGIEAGQNPEKQTEQMAGNLLDGLDGMMNPENFEIPKLEEFEPVPVESGAVPITFDDSALKEWEGALARANAAEPPTKVEIPGINTDRANRMGGILNTDHGGEVQKLSSSGTFSAFSAAALGNDVQKNIAENTEQMVTVLKDIRRRGNAGFQFT